MNPKIFRYCNLFPPDVSEAGRFLLCVLAFVPPLGEKAVCRILKGVISDDNLPLLLRNLVNGGYLNFYATGQGTIYGLTAKALRYLDVDREEAHHKAPPIGDRPLTQNRIRGEVAAAAIVRITAAIYLREWDAQTDQWRNKYLAENRLPSITATLDTTTIDLLPRELVSTAQLSKAVGEAIECGLVPFTAAHTTAIYTAVDIPLLHLLHAYDAAQRHKRSLQAQRQRAGLFVRHEVPDKQSTPEQAERYNALTRELAAVDKSIQDLAIKVSLFTYGNGQKILSLGILNQNGIFVESITAISIKIGILNDSPNGGLSVKALSLRLDYATTLASNLGLSLTVTICTLPSSTVTTKKALALALKKLGPAFPTPPIQWQEVPDTRPRLKYLTKQAFR